MDVVENKAPDAAKDAVVDVVENKAPDAAKDAVVDVVEIRDFSFAYAVDSADGAGINGEAHPALSHVSLNVFEGAFCVIVGDTASGKTTLLRCMKPELTPRGTSSGYISVCGHELVCNGAFQNALTQRESAEQIGFIMQSPDDQIVCDTVWHELAFGLENLGMPPDEMRRRVAEVAHFFGIEGWMESLTSTLSGGQKQLMNLAAVLAHRPKLVLMDEPASQLDATARVQFYALLARANQELGTTVVMTTHAPEEVERYATMRYDLSESGPVLSIERMQEHLSARLEGEVFSNATPNSITFSEVHFRYKRNAPLVLRGLNLKVKEGCVHAIVGGNGCGKSTLLRLAAGLEKPQRGTVVNSLASAQAFLPQDPKAMFVCDTVSEELCEWKARCGYSNEDVDAAIKRCGLVAHVNQHPYDLSGGQQQKLALAKLLLCNPQLLLLDEPTKGLDPASCADVVKLVRELADEGRSVLVVSHDLDFVYVCADAVTMLFDGNAVCTESTQDFFKNNLVYRPSRTSRLFGALLA